MTTGPSLGFAMLATPFHHREKPLIDAALCCRCVHPLREPMLSVGEFSVIRHSDIHSPSRSMRRPHAAHSSARWHEGVSGRHRRYLGREPRDGHRKRHTTTPGKRSTNAPAVKHHESAIRSVGRRLLWVALGLGPRARPDHGLPPCQPAAIGHMSPARAASAIKDGIFPMPAWWNAAPFRRILQPC
jgi:hypothetical protein